MSESDATIALRDAVLFLQRIKSFWFLGCMAWVSHVEAKSLVMKPHHNLLILCMGIAMSAMATEPPAGEGASTEIAVRLDHVTDDWRSPAESGSASYSRAVSLEEDGLFHVTIRSSIGVIRVRGAYRDSALTIPHGRFVFAHANGRVAAAGYYRDGIKTGAWFRYGVGGEQLAVREYSGKTVDEMLDSFGVVSVARTIAAQPMAAHTAQRHMTRPMEF